LSRSTLGKLALLAVLVALGAFLVRGVKIAADPEDFRAFYCGGRAVAEHRDPYLAEPLRTCEVNAARAAGLSPYARLAVPVPLPGFAFVPFAALSRIPLDVASKLYLLLLVIALVVTVVWLRALSGVTPIGIAAALLLSDGWLSIANGQLVPIALLALCGCALALSRGRFVLASAFALLAAIEPHVALPLWLSLAVAAPKTRVPLAAGALLLAALSLLAIGLPANIEYLLQVLPAHAKSEAGAGSQYSLTAVLVSCGVARDAAIALADGWYALICIFGALVARRLAVVLNAPELLALTAPAFALFGAPFVHLTQVAVAVPLLLVLIRRAPERRNAFGIALVLLALPWADLAENAAGPMLFAIAAVAAALAVSIWGPRVQPVALALAGALALGAGEKALSAAYGARSIDATAALAATGGGGAQLAETTWAAFVAVAQAEDRRLYFGSHLPTWLGLGLMIAATAGVAKRP